MKSGVELIYRSINSVHNHILPIWDMSKFHISLLFFGGVGGGGGGGGGGGIC